MKLVTIAVTRSKSAHVKTLHTILKLNILCVQNSVDHQILYCADDPFEKAATVERCMKLYDRILFIDFGIGVDEKSLHKCLEINDSAGLVVFPGVRDGIDWEQFKRKVKAGSTEPTSQMGLTFDTPPVQRGTQGHSLGYYEWTLAVTLYRIHDDKLEYPKVTNQ